MSRATMVMPVGRKVSEKLKPSMSRTAISKRGGATVESQRNKEAYLMWRSMPALLRMLPAADLTKMGYDVDDPMFKKLIEIKNESQFTVVFGLSNNQPARWREDPEFNRQVQELAVNDHVMRFKKDVDFAFTQKTIREADSGRVKLWKQLYEGWREKVETFNHNANLDVLGLVRAIEERNRNIRAGKPRSVDPDSLSPSDDE